MFRILLLLLLSATLSLAQAADSDKSAAIKNTLQKNYGQFIGTVDEVNPSPIPGLYEVVSGYHIFYTDESVQYLIDGNLIDLKARRNLTEARSRQLLSFDRLPLELAVKKVKGNGTRKMAYFTDPNCGYCKKLEQELKNIDDVTLYIFLYPIFQGSEEKVQAVWCSKDRVKAWSDLMLNGIQPVAGKCDTPTAQVKQLAAKLKVNGTPALIFADGVLVPGFLPGAQLEQALKTASDFEKR